MTCLTCCLVHANEFIMTFKKCTWNQHSLLVPITFTRLMYVLSDQWCNSCVFAVSSIICEGSDSQLLCGKLVNATVQFNHVVTCILVTSPHQHPGLSFLFLRSRWDPYSACQLWSSSTRCVFHWAPTSTTQKHQLPQPIHHQQNGRKVLKPSVCI